MNRKNFNVQEKAECATAMTEKAKEMVNFIKNGIEKKNTHYRKYRLDYVGENGYQVMLRLAVPSSVKEDYVLFDKVLFFDTDCDWKVAVRDISKFIEVCTMSLSSYTF